VFPEKVLTMEVHMVKSRWRVERRQVDIEEI